ncbi:MAG: GNAT family N-acetyltransferase [Alphaproteobacteria bacterium]|nr:GNAT family N-acetyltransferase [Alphaproteobacteria bacterium]
MPGVQVITATIADHPTVQNMARFYVYDMSRECGAHYSGWECPADGLFECDDLKSYFTDSTRKAYIVKVADELAGFVLINKLDFLPASFNMGEFFILAKFQRKGIAQIVARQVFDMHQGTWSVGAIPMNKRALHFWRRVIGDYTGGDYMERLYTSDELKNPEHPDPYPMIMMTFDSRKEVSRESGLHFMMSKNPIFDVQMSRELRMELEMLTGITDDFLEQNIYAFDGDEPVAGARAEVHGKILWIDSIFVKDTYRTKGLGSELLNLVEQYAGEVNAKEIQLNTFFPEAHKFFLKCGFEDIAIVPDWKYGLTCYMMRKTL